MFGEVIGLSSILAKFVFDFRQSVALQKYGGPNTIWVVIWAKIWGNFLLVKKGAAWVECLQLFYEHSPGPHGWCSIGGRLLGVGRWNGGYIRNFPLFIAPTVLRVGGPTGPEFGMVVDLSSAFDKIVFVFRQSFAVQKSSIVVVHRARCVGQANHLGNQSATRVHSAWHPSWVGKMSTNETDTPRNALGLTV